MQHIDEKNIILIKNGRNEIKLKHDLNEIKR